MSLKTWKQEVTSVRGEYSVRVKSALATNANESSSLPAFPTPTARDWKGAYSEESQKKKPRKLLPDAVKKVTNWPTPQTSDRNGAADPTRKDHRTQLRDVETGHLPQGKSWATPQASDHVEGARTRTDSNQKCLGRDLNRMKMFPTIRAQEPARTAKGYGRGLAELVEGKKQIDPDSPPVPTNDNTNGKNQGSPKLNPNWVEQLMGVPVGLTQLPTGLID